MTINCIRERVLLLKKLWNRYHDNKHCSILLQQLKSDIIFFCGEKIPDELQTEIDDLQKEIYNYDNQQ